MKTAQRRTKVTEEKGRGERKEDQSVLRQWSIADAMRQLMYMQVRALLQQTSSGRGGAAIVDIRRRYGGFEVAGIAVFVSHFLLVAKKKMAGEIQEREIRS